MKEIHHIIIVGKTIIIKTSFLILPINLMLYQNNNETLLGGNRILNIIKRINFHI